MRTSSPQEDEFLGRRTNCLGTEVLGNVPRCDLSPSACDHQTLSYLRCHVKIQCLPPPWRVRVGTRDIRQAKSLRFCSCASFNVPELGDTFKRVQCPPWSGSLLPPHHLLALLLPLESVRTYSQLRALWEANSVASQLWKLLVSPQGSVGALLLGKPSPGDGSPVPLMHAPVLASAALTVLPWIVSMSGSHISSCLSSWSP